MWRIHQTSVWLSVFLAAGPVLAQEVDIEIPTLVLDDADDRTGDEDLELDRLVISAAKRIQPVEQAASIVTVVTRAQMLVHGYRTLADVVDEAPGFEGYRPGFYFDSGDAFVRGNGRTVLTLWNGVPLNSPETNRRPFGPYLPLSAMGRVETVSGPGGVLWGANALLGIVSITGLRGRDMATPVELSALVSTGEAAADTQGGHATVAYVSPGGEVEILAHLLLSTGEGMILDPGYDLRIAPSPAPDTDATMILRDASGSTRNRRDLWMPLVLAVDAGPVSLDLVYPLLLHEYREFNDIGVRSDSPLATGQAGPSSERVERFALASLRYAGDLSPASRVVVRGYATSFEDRWATMVEVPPGLLSPDAVLVSETYTGMSPLLHDGAYRGGLSLDYLLDFARLQLVLGGEGYVEGVRELRRGLSGRLSGIDAWVVSNPGRRVVTSVYANLHVDPLPRAALEAGVRGQYAPDAYDPLLLGFLAARWNPSGAWNLKLNLAQGFRPPALALIHGNDETNPFPHRESNPGLGAERSLSLEGQVSTRVVVDAVGVDAVELRSGYQRTRLDDLITFASDGKPINANRRVIDSFDARLDAVLPASNRLSFAYGLVQGVDLESGPLRQIPEHRLRLSLDARLGEHARLYVGVLVTGGSEDLDRLASPAAGGTYLASPASVVVDRMPASAVVDTSLVFSRVLAGRVDLAVHVDNLLDARRYIADPDFERRQAILPMRAPGRAGRLVLTWRM